MATGKPIFKSGKPFTAYGEHDGSLALTELDKIPLSPDEIYQGLDMTGHCRTGALFQVIYNDDGNESVKATIGSDPGQPTPTKSDPKWVLNTAGKSGVQELILKFKNFNQSSCVRGSMSICKIN